MLNDAHNLKLKLIIALTAHSANQFEKLSELHLLQ